MRVWPTCGEPPDRHLGHDEDGGDLRRDDRLIARRLCGPDHGASHDRKGLIKKMRNAVCIGIGQFFGPMVIAAAVVAIVGAIFSAIGNVIAADMRASHDSAAGQASRPFVPVPRPFPIGRERAGQRDKMGVCPWACPAGDSKFSRAFSGLLSRFLAGGTGGTKRMILSRPWDSIILHHFAL
jgi:hypothetical protein